MRARMALGLAVAVTAAPARADEERAPVGMELRAGPTVTLPQGTACGQDLDVVGCAPVAFAGAEIGSELRLLPWLGAGLGGAVQLGKVTDRSERLWRGAVEARVHPLGPARLDPWLGVSAGAALLEETATPSSGAASADRRTVRTLGAELGADVALGRWLTLGLALHALSVPFGGAAEHHHGDLAAPTFATFGSSTWLGGSVVLGARWPLWTSR